VAEETGRAGRRGGNEAASSPAPNQSFLGWLASDSYDAYREPVTCLRTRENQSA
jgi:hypothetical protein